MSRTTVTKCVSLPPELAAQLTNSAESDGIPESLIVRWALEKFFSSAKRANSRARAAKRTKS